MILYRQVCFFRFAFQYGIRNVPKEVIRILGRSCVEFSNNCIIACLENKRVLGYGVVRRLPRKYIFCEGKAYIIGPIFVDKDSRGRGIGTEIIRNLLNVCGNNCNIYAYVGINNFGSIKAFENNDFSKIGYMKKTDGKFHIVSNASDFYVMLR